MSKYQLRVFDPRKGDSFDYRISRHEYFHSHASGFFVLNSWPDTRIWSSKLDSHVTRAPSYWELFVRAVQETSRLLLLIVDRRESAIQSDPAVSGLKLLSTDVSLLVYSEPSIERIQLFFDLQQKYQTYGEWIFAGCNDNLKLPNRIANWSELAQPSSLELILPQHEKLGCFLYRNGETSEIIFGSRLFRDLDVLVERSRTG